MRNGFTNPAQPGQIALRRIAMISEHASPLADPGSVDSGGQNVYVAQVARHLARLGLQVDVFTRRDNEVLPEIVNWEDGVRVILVPAGPPVFVPKEDLLDYMGDFTQFILSFCQYHGGYDLIHANFWMSGLVAADLKKALGIPFVITFHALGKVRRRYQGKKDGFPDARFEIEERIINEADGIIAECPQDEIDLTMLYQANPRKIEIIPCGFDPQEMWPVDKLEARQALGIPANERVLLQLGRMVPRKGVDNAIRGFARMVKVHGLSGRLVIVGGESEDPDPKKTPEIGRLLKIAKQEGVADRVTFVGRRGRRMLKIYYSAADVFISTPWYEPFGITPLEAMACGTPVIGAKVGGIQYTVADGETGYLVSPQDPEALGDRLADLFHNPGELERFSQQAIRRVNQYFTWQQVALAVRRFFSKLAQPAVPVSNGRKHGLSKNAQTMKAPPVGLPSTPVAENLASPLSNPLTVIETGFHEAAEAINQSRRVLASQVLVAANAMIACLARGNKVLVCGNGGSAAESQHFAAEFVGRYRYANRAGMPVMALTADGAFLTAWSNDAAYEQVFARQVEAFGQPGDLLVGISTSGDSCNVIEAFKKAQALGLTTLALLGKGGGELLAFADIAVVVPSDDTPHIQEVQLVVLHLISEVVEAHFANPPEGQHKAGTASPASPGLLDNSTTTWGFLPVIPVEMPGSD